MFIDNHAFWKALENLVQQSQIVIDRPKNTAHPRYPTMIYPADYGYLSDTKSMDGGGIDVYCGKNSSGEITGVLCTIDLMKRDSEIKILIGCSDDEMQEIYQFHNHSANMKALLMKNSRLNNQL